jgi:folate-binding protein YgfZ
MNLKGQQVAWMRVSAEADALFCELPIAVRDTVVETFLHYKVGAPVRFEKPETVVFGVFGAMAAEMLNACGFTVLPADPGAFVACPFHDRSVRIHRALDLPADGFSLHVEPAQVEAVTQALFSHLGAAMAAFTLDTLRVEEGLPWHGVDVMEENLLHETGQLNLYHSSSKGCYLGQEVVARLEGRGGNVNKKFLGLRCASAVAAGTEIVSEDKVIGRVTSVGISPQFGPIAMGYVHRSHAEPGTTAKVAGVSCTVTNLPFAP